MEPLKKANGLRDVPFQGLSLEGSGALSLRLITAAHRSVAPISW